MDASSSTNTSAVSFGRGRGRKRKQQLEIRGSTTLMPARLIQNEGNMENPNPEMNSNDINDLGPPLLKPMVKRRPGRPRLYHPNVPLWIRKQLSAPKAQRAHSQILNPYAIRKRKPKNVDDTNGTRKRRRTKLIPTATTTTENPLNLSGNQDNEDTKKSLKELVIKKEPVVVLKNLNLPTNCRLRVREVEEPPPPPPAPRPPKTPKSPPPMQPMPKPKSIKTVKLPDTMPVLSQNPAFVPVEDERIESMPNPLKLDSGDMSLSSSVVCRTCGVAGANRFSIIGVKAEHFNLIHILKTYLDIEIFDNDNLPLHICQICSQTVITFYKFHKRVMAATNRLKAILNESGGKNNWHQVPWYGDNILAMATASTEFLTQKHNREKEKTEGKRKKSSPKFLTTNIEKIFGEKSTNNNQLDADLTAPDSFDNYASDTGSDVEFISTSQNNENATTSSPKPSSSNVQAERSKIEFVNIDDIAPKRTPSASTNVSPLPSTSSAKTTNLKTKQPQTTPKSTPKNKPVPIKLTPTTIPPKKNQSDVVPVLMPLTKQDNTVLKNTFLPSANQKPSTPQVQKTSNTVTPAISRTITQPVTVQKLATIPKQVRLTPLSKTSLVPTLVTTNTLTTRPIAVAKSAVSTPVSSRQITVASSPSTSATAPVAKKVTLAGKSKSVLLVTNQPSSATPVDKSKPTSLEPQETITGTFLLETDSQSGLNVLTPVPIEQVTKLMSTPGVKTGTQLMKVSNLNTLIQPSPTGKVQLKVIPSTNVATSTATSATTVIDLTGNTMPKVTATPQTTTQTTVQTTAPTSETNPVVSKNVPIAPKKPDEPKPDEPKEFNWALEETKLLKDVRLPSKDDKYTYVVKMDRKEKSEQPYYVLSANPSKLKVAELTLYNVGIISKDIYKAEVEKKKSKQGDFVKIGPHSWAQHIIWLWQLKLKGDVKAYVKQSADKILEFGNRVKADFERRCNQQSKNIVNKCINTSKSDTTTSTTSQDPLSSSPSVTSLTSATVSNPSIVSPNTAISSLKLPAQNTNVTAPVIFIAPNTTIPQNTQIPSSILLNQSTTPSVPLLISPATQEPLYLIPVSNPSTPVVPLNTIFPALPTLTTIPTTIAVTNAVAGPSTSSAVVTPKSVSKPSTTVIPQNSTTTQITQNNLVKPPPVSTQSNTTPTIDLSKDTSNSISELLKPSTAPTSVDLVDDAMEEMFSELTNSKPASPEKKPETPKKSNAAARKIQISYEDTEERFDMECVSEDEESTHETNEEKLPDTSVEDSQKVDDKPSDPQESELDEKKSETLTVQHVDSVIWNELDTQMVVEID